MKKNYFYLLALATALLQFSSCSSSDEPKAEPNYGPPAELKITTSMVLSANEVKTRAAHDINSTGFATAAEYQNIGIFVWEVGNTAPKTTGVNYAGYPNVQVSSATPDGTSGNFPYTLGTTNPMYFPIDNADVNVYLYTPYTSGNTHYDENMIMTHTVAVDQSLTAAYVASDFIYGKDTVKYSGSVSPKVDKTARVNMYHAMSKVIFIVEPAAGVDVSGLSEISIEGVLKTTTIRLANNVDGEVLTTGSVGTKNVGEANTSATIKVWGTTGDGEVSLANTQTTGVAAIIPPQTGTATTKVAVTVSGRTAKADLNGKDFLPGKVYTFNLKLAGNGALTITLLKIVDWASGQVSAENLDFNNWTTP